MVKDTISDMHDFGDFFEKSFEPIYHFIRRYISDDMVAKDLAQDTFLRVYEKRADFQSQLHAKSYTYIVAKNLSLDFLKHQKVRNQYAESLVDIPVEDNDFIKNIIYTETVHTVKVALATLSPQSKRIIELSMEGLSNDEIAQELQISINTVKTIKKRAYEKLRQLLASEYTDGITLAVLLAGLMVLLLN